VCASSEPARWACLTRVERPRTLGPTVHVAEGEPAGSRVYGERRSAAPQRTGSPAARPGGDPSMTGWRLFTIEEVNALSRRSRLGGPAK